MKEQGVSATAASRPAPLHAQRHRAGQRLTRAVLVLLCEAYARDESRRASTVEFKPKFAPIKAGSSRS
jgi:hypothetical protein